jgi:hypothetical protein
MSTTSSTNSASSAHFFTPISKSSSVPDIHKNAELEGTDTSGTNSSKTNTTSDLNNSSSVHKTANQKRQKLDSKDSNNLIITNSDSTESAIASPAGSLEQFEVSGFNNSALPLTPDDHADSMNG